MSLVYMVDKTTNIKEINFYLSKVENLIGRTSNIL